MKDSIRQTVRDTIKQQIIPAEEVPQDIPPADSNSVPPVEEPVVPDTDNGADE